MEFSSFTSVFVVISSKGCLKLQWLALLFPASPSTLQCGNKKQYGVMWILELQSLATHQMVLSEAYSSDFGLQGHSILRVVWLLLLGKII